MEATKLFQTMMTNCSKMAHHVLLVNLTSFLYSLLIHLSGTPKYLSFVSFAIDSIFDVFQSQVRVTHWWIFDSTVLDSRHLHYNLSSKCYVCPS